MDVLNKKIGNNIDFLYIKSEKFKSAEISVSFFFPISEI